MFEFHLFLAVNSELDFLLVCSWKKKGFKDIKVEI